MVRLLRLSIIFFALVFILLDVNAQSKVALIIGNADYSPSGDEWENLSSPIADAKIMNEKLKELGYKTKVNNPHCLLSTQLYFGH